MQKSWTSEATLLIELAAPVHDYHREVTEIPYGFCFPSNTSHWIVIVAQGESVEHKPMTFPTPWELKWMLNNCQSLVKIMVCIY